MRWRPGFLDRFVALIAREAGRTLDDGVAEVREAIDFCRYYATLAERLFVPEPPLPGPGRRKQPARAARPRRLRLHQPVEFSAVDLHRPDHSRACRGQCSDRQAGRANAADRGRSGAHIRSRQVSTATCSSPSLPARGEKVGAALVADSGIAGVAFTGGTDTARAINRALAVRPGPIIPFIAETGGLNAMFIDTSALREQLVDDALTSAFGSAGQRCSSLRVLFVPREIADDTLATLAGALATLVIGDPADPATDIGPVIDDDALMPRSMPMSCGCKPRPASSPASTRGSWRRVAAISDRSSPEIPSPDFLEREVFGPILHVYRYGPAELPDVARRLAARGYGLTLGVHSRIERFADEVRALVPAGNAYVNRTIIGAVVGVQPFGGEGLSGTGPKAGGPHSLTRYAVERAISVNTAAQGGDPALFNL